MCWFIIKVAEQHSPGWNMAQCVGRVRYPQSGACVHQSGLITNSASSALRFCNAVCAVAPPCILAALITKILDYVSPSQHGFNDQVMFSCPAFTLGIQSMKHLFAPFLVLLDKEGHVDVVMFLQVKHLYPFVMPMVFSSSTAGLKLKAEAQKPHTLKPSTGIQKKIMEATHSRHDSHGSSVTPVWCDLMHSWIRS